MAIKLENINNVKYIIENTTKLNRNIIDINAKDSNGEYPIIVAYDHANSRAGEEIFAYLLKHGASINVKTRQGITLLRDALQNRKYRVLKHILNYPLSLDEKEVTNKYYAFPLIKAIYHNNFEEVRSIAMKNNYRLDVYTYTNIRIDYSKCLFTPLILAYLLDYKEIFQFLIKYADINALDSHGYRLLHYAILREDIDTIDYLITHGADVNYKENWKKQGHSALDISITIGNSNVFFALLNSKNILFNIPNKEGELPLSTIIRSKHYSIDEKKTMMENLLRRGSYINFIDVNSPLKDAIQEESIPLIHILLENEASVNYIFEKNGYTPLIYAIKAKSLPIIKLLVEKGADVNYTLPQIYDNIKETVLLQAIEEGDLEIFEYLLKVNAALSFDRLNENNRFIEAVAKNGKTEIFEYLIKNNLNQFTDNVIESVVYLNQIDLLKLLVRSNFDVNFRDKNGNTPLTYAIHYSNEYFVDYLLHYGANIYNINNDGESLCDISNKYSKRLRGHTIHKKIKSLLNNN